MYCVAARCFGLKRRAVSASQRVGIASGVVRSACEMLIKLIKLIKLMKLMKLMKRA